MATSNAFPACLPPFMVIRFPGTAHCTALKQPNYITSLLIASLDRLFPEKPAVS
ncbi:MAG: hypothetical protein AAFY57_16040 [Cyanobacteria bacterium J06642_2]